MKETVTILPDVELDAGKRIYFISDLHLGAPYSKGSLDAEKRVVRFLDSIKHDAHTLFMLGDIIDYWFEYRYCVPKGFIRFFGKLAELADSGVKLVWIIGNHDIWIKDYLPSQFEIEIYDGQVCQRINSSNFFLAHGDGLGKTPIMFGLIRRIFRNKLCQKLYGAIHPRWTIPFALAWSGSSRKRGDSMPKSQTPLLHGLRNYSLSELNQHPEIDFFVYGHLHIFEREVLKPGKEMLIAGDWITHNSYLEFDGENLMMKTFQD